LRYGLKRRYKSDKLTEEIILYYETYKSRCFGYVRSILKQTGDEFVPFVQRTFPDLMPDEIYAHWLEADIGAITSLEIWQRIGYQGDLERIEKEFLDSLEINDGFMRSLRLQGSSTKWRLFRTTRANGADIFGASSMLTGISMSSASAGT
jgi:hypothetical protein